MLGVLIFKLRALISILVRFCPHLASGKSAGHTGLSTRGGHLIRPTSPKSPSASAFESIEGSDDEDNMTDNSKVDSTYLYTNGDVREEDTVDDLIDLVKQIVAFHMQVKHLNLLKKHVDKASYKRTFLYLSSSAKYLPEPEDLQVIDIGYMMYMKFKDYPRALQIALFRDNMQVSCTQILVETIKQSSGTS